MLRTNRKIVISSVIVAVVIGLFILYLTLVLTWNSYDKCDTGSLPHIFSTLQYNKTFTIYWDKPVCNVTFLLKYTIEDQPPILVYLSNTSWTVEEKLEPCDVVDVQLWAVTKGEVSESFVSDNFIVYPQIVSFVNTTQSLNEDGALTLAWENPSPSPKCKVHYTVTCTTDTDLWGYETASESILIRSDLFCFEVYTILEAWVGNRPFAITTGKFEIAVLPTVEDLSLTQLDTNIWQVSWTAHSKPEQCNINYEITVSDGVDIIAEITKESSHTFEVDNCDFFTVAVKAVSGELRSEEITITEHCGNVGQ